MADEVALRLFGSFQAAVNGNPVPEGSWHGHRAKAVVKLLGLAPNHRLHREQLMDSLWPGLPPPAAGANLRKALHYARRALPPDALRVRDAVVSLEAPGLTVDVDDFRAALAVGDVATAINLYTDDLLIEDRYEPWAEEYRTHLRERFSGLLHRAAARSLQDGDLTRAADLFGRLLRLDPSDTAAVAGLARTGSARGEATGAVPVPRAPGAPVRRSTGAGPASPPRAVSERRLVTVAVLEAVAAPEVTDPELLAHHLEGWASLAAEVVNSWDGSGERLLPGTVVAVFGVPRLHEDDATRTLQAGLDLVARSPVGTRIGVATGEVIVPTELAPAVRHLTGQALEVANRLREASAPGGITVAERTCRLVTQFRFGPPLRLTGTGLPEIWGRTLVGPLVRVPEAVRADAPMVGRDAELASVVAAFDDAARTGRPRLVTVVGAAGIGKSRLAEEAVRAIVARNRTTRALTGRCATAARAGSYSALAEILRQACGISLTDPIPTVQRKLRRGLTALFAEHAVSEAALGALGAAIGVAMPGGSLDHLEPSAVAHELREAWPRFVTAMATCSPAVLVLEDLHWAGEELLSALAAIATRARGRVLVLTTGRPELLTDHPSWLEGVQEWLTLELPPLTEADSRFILGHLRSADALPAATRRQLLARAEGNPFFLQELALHAGAGSSSVPDTVTAVLASRLDATRPEDKLVLQYAAVVGRVFWAAPVARGTGSDDVPAALSRLVTQGFLVRRQTSTLPSHPEYMFRHALTHQVTYASLPRGLRARAHAEVARWLEDVAGSGRTDLAELLAAHWSVASDDAAHLGWHEPRERERVRASAVHWLIRAGDVARARFATARALRWHERALSLVATDAERITALEALGRDHDAAFHGEEATQHYEAALSIARADPRLHTERARLCRRIAWLMAASPGAFVASPDPHRVEALIAEGLRASGHDLERAWLLLAHGISARLWQCTEPFGQGSEPDPVPIETRVRDAETALRMGHAQAQPDLVMGAERALKILYGLAGRYPEAVTLAYRHLDALPAARSTLEQADLLREAAVYAVTLDADFRRGLTLAQRCHDLSAGTAPHQLMHTTWPLLVALYHLGRWDELNIVAEEHLRALRKMSGTSQCQFLSDGPLILATMQAHRGRPLARHHLDQDIGHGTDDPDSASPWRARLELARRDLPEARRLATAGATRGGLVGPQYVLCLLEALTTLQDWPALEAALPAAQAAAAGNPLLGPARSRATALLLARNGRRDEAADVLREVVTELDALGVPFEAARAREDLAPLLPTGVARRVLDDAADTYRWLGAEPHLHRVRAQQRNVRPAPQVSK